MGFDHEGIRSTMSLRTIAGRSVALLATTLLIIGVAPARAAYAPVEPYAEYQPLGPFLAKNFATTISPWIVTMEALAPFRTSWKRPAGDPQPLPYLDNASVRTSGAVDMQLEALLQTRQMREKSVQPQRLSRSNFRHSYWTVAQMVAHHTVNGCNLAPGDLLGSGTQSGPDPSEAGSLLELTGGGKQPLTLPGGETRTFLEDGDCVIFRAWCEREGHRRIGFGEARATIRG